MHWRAGFAASSTGVDCRYGAGMTSGEVDDTQQTSVRQAEAFDPVRDASRSPGPCTTRRAYQWHLAKDAFAL